MKCIICKNNSFHFTSNLDLFSKEKFEIYFCKSCKHGTTKCENIDLKSYYPKNYYGINSKKFNFIIEKFISFFRLFRFYYCKKLLRNKNIKVLDIGCGRGEFLDIFKKNSAYVFGTEFSDLSAKNAISKIGEKNIIIGNNFERLLAIKDTFNLITLWHVLEHFDDIDSLKKILNNKLEKNGILVIEVPNIESVQFSINKKNWLYLECPRHVNHFSYNSLNKLFDKNNFQILNYSTFSLEFGFFGMLQSLLNLFTPIPNFLFNVLRNKNSSISDFSLISKFISYLITLLFIIPFLFISVFLELTSILFNKGSIIRIALKKN